MYHSPDCASSGRDGSKYGQRCEHQTRHGTSIASLVRLSVPGLFIQA